MSEPRDPDDDLAALLADLDRTLGDLRDELEERESDGRDRNGRTDDRDGGRRGGPTARQAERYGYRRRERGDRSDADGRDRPLPRPPSLGEMLRFTEEYTIPTVISMLEATVRSLELLRSALRLVDPQRSAFDDGDRRRSTTDRLAATTMGREALSGVDRAIDDLRDALSGLPEEEESRSIVTDARDLMGEIEARIDEAERERERSKYGYREREESGREHGNRRDRDRAGGNGRGRREESRTIDVTDEDDEEESPRVDVDAELASIRKEVRGDDGAEASDDAPESDETRDEDPGDGA